MDSHLWWFVALFAVYLLLAVTEAASQLLNKHRTQVLLDAMRQGSGLNRLLLPRSAGSLRSVLNIGKLISLVSLVVFAAVVGEYTDTTTTIIALVLLGITIYAPVLIAKRSPRAILRALLPLVRFANIVLLSISIPRDFLFNSYRAGARKQNGDTEDDDTQELEAYIGEAEEEGLFEPDEAEMVRQVVEFSDTVVREVMTPRINMECIDRSATLAQFLTKAKEEKFSRYPVIDGKIDDVVGLVHVKNLLGMPAEVMETETVSAIMVEPYFVPESKKISALLRDLQSDKQQLTVVVDEYGGIAGVITVEDILEEIVGEIEDEHDTEEEDREIVRNRDGSLNVSGNVDVTEVEKILDVQLDDKSYETVSGLALSHLKHIPKPGEEFVTDTGIKVEILDANERSINRLRLSKSPAQNE